MRTFTGKWDSELKRNHEEQLKRERKLRELSEHIQTICDECEQAKKNQEQAME